MPRPTLVGVVNVTPDSFSDGGNFFSTPAAVDHALRLLDEGADVVEIGGESTRPGAVGVGVADELARVVPVVAGIRRARPGARIAIDTVKAAVAAAALDQGAGVVNDVSAFRLDTDMGRVCAEAGCTVVLMHSRGGVEEMARYDHARYDDGAGGVTGAVLRELGAAIVRATAAGVARDRIVLDPGIGFAKRPEDSLRALAEVPRLVELGFPIMVGASRKRFIGELTGTRVPGERDAGSVGAHVAALCGGASWFRVHAVRMHRAALDVAARIADERVAAGIAAGIAAGTAAGIAAGIAAGTAAGGAGQ